jgi:Domain of unknown function (DUF4157)
MSTLVPMQSLAAKPKAVGSSAHAGLLLQRKHTYKTPAASLTGELGDSKSPQRLQAKLAIGASNDALEQEADRVADQVLAAPTHSAISGAPPFIQRFTGEPRASASVSPTSVDRVLASSGRPLEPALRNDMEQRFGHDFSRVRVHSGAEATQSARDVNAYAYTVGHNVVFGSGRFAPRTREGQHLIAHELTHVVQQSGTNGTATIQRKLEFRAPGKGEASAIGRAQELVDRFNKLSAGLRYELKAGELAYTVLDASKLSHFDRVMQGFIDRGEVVPMRLITSKGRVGGGTLFGDSLQAAYVDVDDMLADDDFSFQSDFLHFLTERFQVKDYARRIGTSMDKEFPRAHRAGKDAEALQLQMLLNDPSIAFLYEELKPDNTWVNAFRSKALGYRVFQVVRKSAQETAGGEMWVQKKDGTRTSMNDFIKLRATGGS